jgi:hypothetical protein
MCFGIKAGFLLISEIDAYSLPELRFCSFDLLPFNFFVIIALKYKIDIIYDTPIVKMKFTHCDFH